MFAPDVSVMNWFAGHRAGWATHLATAVMDANGSAVVTGVLLLLAAVYVVVRRQWVAGLSVGIAGELAVVATGALKTLIARPRPPEAFALVDAPGYSMPSTAGALTMAAAAAFFLATTWRTSRARNIAGIVLTVPVVVVGICVVYLGAHWPSDVLAGWAVGGLMGAVIAWSGAAARRHVSATRRPAGDALNRRSGADTQ